MTESDIEIKIGRIKIMGDLVLPAGAKAIVVFSHGSASSRFSPRNVFVARYLNKFGIATLLIDLLTKKEDQKDNLTAEFRFNIDLLTERLIGTTQWLREEPLTKTLNIGYFGASTGAASSLKAAAKLGYGIKAVVSRGGRPDLAGYSLASLKSPALFIVGSNDPEVVKLNEQALSKIKINKELLLIPGATHLFEEPGALEQVAKAANGWFLKHLTYMDADSEKKEQYVS